MAELKTRQNRRSVRAFLDGIEDKRKRADSREVSKLMAQITGHRPRMWGTSLVGFGRYHYKYASGHEGDAFLTGFSPRKQALTIYIMPGFSRYEPLMKNLGKYRTGKSCLYIKTLDDIDRGILKTLIVRSVRETRKKYDCD